MSMTERAIESDKKLGLPLLEVEKIYLNHQFNCRGQFSPVDCVELAKDIAERGLQQPIIVRPVRTEASPGFSVEEDLIRKGYKYKIIAGHRRLMAYRINEHSTIPCIIKTGTISEFEEKDINAIENLHREDLNLQQECNAIRHYWMAGWTREDTAMRINKSTGWVQIRYMLLELPIEVQQLAGQGYLTINDIRNIYKESDTGEQLKLAALLRDQKRKGAVRGATAIRRRDKPETKKHRSRGDIFERLEEMQEVFMKINPETMIHAKDILTSQGNGLPTRCLAWAAGEITTIDFYTSLRNFCKAAGVDFQIPKLDGKIEQL